MLDRSMDVSNGTTEFDAFSDEQQVKNILANTDIPVLLDLLKIPVAQHESVRMVPVEIKPLSLAGTLNMHLVWKKAN